MIYIISKETDKVKMVCSEPVDFDSNIFYSKEIDDDDYKDNQIYYKDGKLKKEKIEIPEQKKKKIKDEIDSAKNISDIKTILKKLF